MATDEERLLVRIEAQLRQFERGMAQATSAADRAAGRIESRFRTMSHNLDRVGSNLGRGLVAPLTGVAAALSVREVIAYGDAWTVAGNKLAAAGTIAGRQARTLEEINEIATRTRSGITETADLYAKLLRSTSAVADSEEEVARATEIVNKAFKAGGAAASEQAAGILQLSQALSSGLLQGDELRSIRENAPLLAQAIANEFKTTIGELKELGAAGELTVDRVFKAILNAQPQIEQAFASTNQTIGESFTRINNAFTQYIGHTDDGLDASERLTQGLNALADNFEQTADIALKLAGVIAAALVGRSIAGMIRSLGLAGVALIRFTSLTRTAGLAASLSGLGAAAGPLGAVLGVAAAAALYFASSTDTAAESTEGAVGWANRFEEALRKVRGEAIAAGDAVEAAALRFPNARVNDLTQELELGTAAANEAAEALKRYFAEVIPDQPSRIISQDQLDRLNDVVDGFDGSADSAAALKEELAALATEADVFQAMKDQTQVWIDSLIAAGDALKDVHEELETLNRTSLQTPAGLARRAQESSMDAFDPQRQPRAIGETFLDERAAEQALDEWEREVRRVTEEIMDGARKIGGAIDYVAARTRAEGEVNAKKLATATTSVIQSYVDEVAQAESGGDASAKNRDSTATGLGQFIEETWLRQFKQEFPDRAKNMSRETMLALRTDADTSRALIEAYARENAAVLQAAGVSVDKAALHLAHFLGAGDAIKVLTAAPGTPLQGLISGASISANPTILGGGRTVDDAIKYAQARAQVETQIRTETAARDELVAGIEREIASLGLEARAFGESTFEAERARVAFDLMQQAIAAGLEITPELTAEIERLATAYANAAASVDLAAKQQDKFGEAQHLAVERMDEFRDAARDVLGGFISDLRQGKSLAESFANVLEGIADKLINMALNGLFAPGGAGGGGFLGFFGRLFGGGGGIGGFGGKSGAKLSFASPVASLGAASRLGIPSPRGGFVQPSRETIEIALNPSEAFVSGVADRQIKTHAGTIVNLSVREGQKATRQNLPGMMREAQVRTF